MWHFYEKIPFQSRLYFKLFKMAGICFDKIGFEILLLINCLFTYVLFSLRQLPRRPCKKSTQLQTKGPDFVAPLAKRRYVQQRHLVPVKSVVVAMPQSSHSKLYLSTLRSHPLCGGSKL